MARNASLFLLLVLALLGCKERQRADSPHAPATGKSFSLVVDFGSDKKKEFPKLAWQKGVTVLDAMDLASNEQQGLEYSTWQDATGEAAFVEQIDSVKNEGAGQGAKNWTYKVNGQRGQVSAGVQTLNAGDQVVWKFGVYEIE